MDRKADHLFFNVRNVIEYRTFVTGAVLCSQSFLAGPWMMYRDRRLTGKACDKGKKSHARKTRENRGEQTLPVTTALISTTHKLPPQ